MAELVGIEGGANGERENLAGVDILHDDGAVVGVGALHVVVEGALSHELNVFVDGELEILAGLGLLRDGAEDVAAGVHGGEHAAGDAVELVVEFAFDAAETVVIETDIAEDLRGDLVVGIEALKFFLEVDALDIEGVERVEISGGTRRAIQAKLLPVFKAVGDLVVRGSACLQGRCGRWRQACGRRACLRSSISEGTA